MQHKTKLVKFNALLVQSPQKHMVANRGQELNWTGPSERVKAGSRQTGSEQNQSPEAEGRSRYLGRGEENRSVTGTV